MHGRRATEKGNGLIKPIAPPKWDQATDVYTVKLQLGYASLPSSDKELFEAVEDVLQGLKRLHSKKLVHRDIRWENIVRLAGDDGSDSRSSWCLVDLETVWAANQVSKGIMV